MAGRGRPKEAMALKSLRGKAHIAKEEIEQQTEYEIYVAEGSIEAPP